MTFCPVERNVVETLLLTAAPERETELRRLFDCYDPAFVLVEGTQGIFLSAGSQRVRFSHKDMSYLWLMGFAAWKAFQCYCPSVILATWIRQPLDPAVFTLDDALEEAQQGFEDLLYTAQALLAAKRSEDVPWPQDIPEPGTDRAALQDRQSLAVFDLVCITAAAVFLHEIRHIQFERDGNRPDHMPDEERQCDSFARTFLLDEVESYARGAKEPSNLAFSKRACGLATAVLFLHETTPTGLDAEVKTHPPIADRFEEWIGKIDAPDGDYFWVYACSLLIAMLRRRNRLTESVSFQSPKDLCARLIALIAKA